MMKMEEQPFIVWNDSKSSWFKTLCTIANLSGSSGGKFGMHNTFFVHFLHCSRPGGCYVLLFQPKDSQRVKQLKEPCILVSAVEITAVERRKVMKNHEGTFYSIPLERVPTRLLIRTTQRNQGLQTGVPA
ncbi:hypothetical protein SUGI_1074080 [Cryptomeria japonica]|nr:hypothetical protein SUGI_1074080 [Cryptomeria japonica]